jgi:hypothetical protein
MANSSHRWLQVVVVTGAIATAASAGAEMRTTAGGGTCRTCVKGGASNPRVASYAPSLSRRAASSSPRDQDTYAREIAEASARYAVPERLIWAVIRVESGFERRAVSSKGARGLMQLMPETAALLGVRDCFDPRQNIQGGTRHLRALMQRFRYDLRLAVAAYNAGEKPVAAYGGVPPYPETQEFVTQVLRFYDDPMERSRLDRKRVQRFVEPDGTVVYTNIPFGGLRTLSYAR